MTCFPSVTMDMSPYITAWPNEPKSQGKPIYGSHWFLVTRTSDIINMDTPESYSCKNLRLCLGLWIENYSYNTLSYNTLSWISFSLRKYLLFIQLGYVNSGPVDKNAFHSCTCLGNFREKMSSLHILWSIKELWNCNCLFQKALLPSPSWQLLCLYNYFLPVSFFIKYFQLKKQRYRLSSNF